MRKNPKQAKAVAYLRQVCCSGLGSGVVIPSGRNWYSAVDAQFNFLYQIPDTFFPELVTLAEVAAFAFSQFSSTEEYWVSYAAWYRQHPVMIDPRNYFKGFYQTDFYNLVSCKIDQHQALEARVIQQGQIVGLFALFRPRNSLPFSD
jgi:hypothetical protein